MCLIRGIISIFGFVFVLGIANAATLSNEFDIVNTNDNILEYYCTESFNTEIIYGGESSYGGFAFGIKFDTGSVEIAHESIDAYYNVNPISSVVGNYYSASASSDNPQKTSNSFPSKFYVKPILVSPYQMGTTLEFVTSQMSSPIFNLLNTSDEMSIPQGSNGDTLSSIINKTLTFEAYPCVDDSVVPKIYNSVSDAVGIYYFVEGSSVLSNSKVLLTGRFKLLVLDWNISNVGGTSVPRWYDGNSTGSLSNYIDNSSQVDSEYGVDGTSLTVDIVNTNPSATSPQNINNAGLTIVAYTGDSNPNKYTWHSENRGYWIEFENASDNLFAVEKPVTITVDGWDNPHRDGTTGSMVGQSFVINQSNVPVMNSIYPAHNTSSVNPDISQIKFSVTDTWAGVDTGKVWLTIPSIENASGVVIMSGHTYSASDMVFSGINGTSGLGNSGGYDVTLNVDASQKPFLADAKIYFTGVVVDLAGYTGYINSGDWYIETRKPCSYFGCNEMLNINIIGGSSAGLYGFTGELLIATGTNPNSPYPYLTGDNGDILMCGVGWTGSSLEGNVDIVDSAGNSIKDDIYTDNVLYIVGLDYTYDPNTGIITVNE